MTPATQLYGILFMLLNTLSLAFLDICTGTLRKMSVDTSLIVFLYKATLLCLILPWVLSKGIKGLKTERIHVHLIRSLLGVAGSLSFIHGLKYVDMADAAALENIQYVLLVLIGMIFFKESFSRTKVAAIVLACIGAVVVVNPYMFGFGAVEASGEKFYGYTLLAIFFWTLNTIAVKLLGRTEKNRAQMFYLLFFSCMWSLPTVTLQLEAVEILGLAIPLIPLGWADMSKFANMWQYAPYILTMAFCYFIHGIAYFNALKYEISTVVPFRYSKMVFSGLLGYFFMQQVPLASAYLGYILIIISGLLLLRYEVRQAKKWPQIKV